MNPTHTLSDQAVAFSFPAIFKGKRVTLTIIPAVAERFSVMENDVLLGQIKIGYHRHTWYVIGSNYVEYVLVNQIAQKILEQSY